jgi:4-amino-4-deoxy-L-arabinose transferase-like glycosyltransferase
MWGMALTRRVPRVALALVALALVLRLAFIVATPGYVPQHDDRDYDRLACGLVAGEGYTRVGPPTPREGCGDEPTGRPTAFRPPGFPMFLAAVYTATEPIGIERWTAARVAQALVGTAVVALLGLVAWQLFGRRTALIAMALGAVFPPAIVLGGSLLTETLFCALMLGALAAVLAYRRSAGAGGDWRWLILAGVICGLAVLTRSNAPALILPLAIGVATTGDRPLRARLGRAAALVGIAALIVAPWTLRNAIALDGFAPVTTEAGSALAGTYNDASRNHPKWPGAWRPPARLRELRPTLDPVRRDEPEEQRALIRRSVDYMADHPGYVAEVGGRNVLRLTGLEGRDWWQYSGRTLSLPSWTADVSGVVFLFFLLLAIIGAFTPAARAAPWWLWLMPVLMVLSVLFVVAETRFRAPTDPFIVLLAALAVAQLAPSKRKAPPAA